MLITSSQSRGHDEFQHRYRWSGGGRARVQNAIAVASAKTGVDFSYLYSQAKLESGLNPNARASSSSATGLYQFIDQSWLGVMKKHGAENGLGWAADAISVGRDGRYHVSDAATKQAILALRKDPETAATMAAEHASDNKAYLETKLGRQIDSTDLYMAHFLGLGGASKFLKGLESNPGGSAAAVLPAAARANRTIFYNRDGSARSFADIRNRFAARMDREDDDASPNYIAPAKTLPQVHLASLDSSDVAAALGANGTTNSLLTPSPQNARLAYLMLSNLGV